MAIWKFVRYTGDLTTLSGQVEFNGNMQRGQPVVVDKTAGGEVPCGGCGCDLQVMYDEGDDYA
jgi:hypothetical protein